MGSRIRMRGVQSLVVDRAPLVLVDGMRVDAGEDSFWPVAAFDDAFRERPRAPGPLRLDDVNPADVEYVEVIPGSASTAVYGPGASAGVLLFHTKRGRPGPPRWQGYAQGGIGSASQSWPANFGGVDLDHANTFFRQGGCSLRFHAAGQCVQDFVQQFNPFDQRSPFRTALLRQYGVSVSGGSTWGDYRVAGELATDAGPYSTGAKSPDPNYHRRLNGRMSGRVRPWSTVELGVSATRVSGDLRLPPNLPRQVGVTGPSDSSGFDWGQMFRTQSTQAVERWSTIVEARWSPWRWIGVHGRAGFDAGDLSDAERSPYIASDPLPVGSWAQGKTKVRHRTLELGATASLAISSAARSTLRLGVQGLRDSLEQRWTIRSDFDGTGFSDPFENAARWMRRNSVGYYLDERLEIGRRLMLGAAVRHDRFKEEDRDAAYPSLSAAWLAHVAADSAPFSRLRFRAAYGSAGPRPFEGVPIIVVPIGTPIPSIEPERTTSTEFGADATLLNGRLGAQLTFYTMHSHVFRLTYQPGAFGIGYYPGTIQNRGIEATITGEVLTSLAARWDITLSLWGNRNRLSEFDGPPFVYGAGVSSGHRIVPGYPVGGYWAYRIESFSDANGDGIIAPTEVALAPEPVWAGTPHPTQGAMLTSEWTLGSSLRAALTFDYRAGHTLFNQFAFDRCRFGTCRAANERGTPLAEQARAAVSFAPTPDYFEDADYLKVRELSVTWYARPRVAAAIGARSVALTLVGRNLLTWTGYSGGDPEAGSYGIIQPGDPRGIADVGALPVPRTWTLRLDVAY